MGGTVGQGMCVPQRPEEALGDYEYDLVHEGTGGRPADTRHPPERPAPPPRHPVELDQDMGYDEAHDF